VYPEENLDPVVLNVQFLKEGQVIAAQRSALPPPDASGAVPMTIQPAAGPGDYEVKITVQQGGQSRQSSLKYTIAAK